MNPQDRDEALKQVAAMREVMAAGNSLPEDPTAYFVLSIVWITAGMRSHLSFGGDSGSWVRVLFWGLSIALLAYSLRRAFRGAKARRAERDKLHPLARRFYEAHDLVFSATVCLTIVLAVAEAGYLANVVFLFFLGVSFLALWKFKTSRLEPFAWILLFISFAIIATHKLNWPAPGGLEDFIAGIWFLGVALRARQLERKSHASAPTFSR